MKAAALVVEAIDGRFHSVGAGSLVQLEVLAKQARENGALPIGGELVAVRRGALMSTWRGVTEFRCQPAAVGDVSGKSKRGKK